VGYVLLAIRCVVEPRKPINYKSLVERAQKGLIQTIKCKKSRYVDDLCKVECH